MAYDENWFLELGDKIYTILKTRMTKSLSTKYPSIHFESTSETSGTATFPSVYFHELDSRERGQDLENTTVNAVTEYIQIDVTSNTDMATCKDVMGEAIKQMKKLRFSIIYRPIYKRDDDRNYGYCRFRRLYGSGDTLE